MKRVVILAVTIFGLSAQAQTQTRGGQTAQPVVQRLAGAWQLESRTVRRADGSVVADAVLGERPPGRLFYDASGVMALQMMRTGRKAAIVAPANPRDKENPRVVLGYDAYFGRFTIDERAGTITHHVDGSLFPEDLGKDFVRGFTLDGDTLTLRFTSTTDGSSITRTLVFRRSR
jgi:lipocalin-like protein